MLALSYGPQPYALLLELTPACQNVNDLGQCQARTNTCPYSKGCTILLILTGHMVDPAGYAPASEHCKCSILAIKLRAQLYYSTVKSIWRASLVLTEYLQIQNLSCRSRYTRRPHLKLITEQSTSQQITNSRQPYQFNTGHSCIPSAR